MRFGPLFLNTFLPNLAFHLPLLIALVVGFVMAIIRWKKHPRASLLTVIATAVASLVVLFSVITNSFLYFLCYEVFGMDFTAVGIISSVLSALFNLLMAGSWVLVLIAIFSKNKQKEEPE